MHEVEGDVLDHGHGPRRLDFGFEADGRTETSRPVPVTPGSAPETGRASPDAKKSIVPTTFSSTMIGKHIAARIPCCFAIAARLYPGPVISPKSGTKTRSRAFQAPPQSPSPSRNLPGRSPCGILRDQ